MNTNTHGAHVADVQTTRTAHAQPLRPAPHAVVPEHAVEPSRPVDGWGFTNRLLILATTFLVAFELIRNAINPPNGSVALGENGRAWVVSVEAMLFGLVGGGLAAMVGYFIILLMGGASRSAARYVVGGVIGGLVAAPLVLIVFSNTAVHGTGVHLFWLLPLAGLLAGLWAGLVSARR